MSVPAGYTIRNVGGDGNCFFRALSHQLYGHEDAHAQLRRELIRHICSHIDRYGAYFQPDAERPETLASMALDKAYVTSEFARAFHDLYRVPVVTYSHAFTTTLPEYYDTTDGNAVRLWHSGMHYKSVVRDEQPPPLAGLLPDVPVTLPPIMPVAPEVLADAKSILEHPVNVRRLRLLLCV